MHCCHHEAPLEEGNVAHYYLVVGETINHVQIIKTTGSKDISFALAETNAVSLADRQAENFTRAVNSDGAGGNHAGEIKLKKDFKAVGHDYSLLEIDCYIHIGGHIHRHALDGHGSTITALINMALSLMHAGARNDIP